MNAKRKEQIERTNALRGDALRKWRAENDAVEAEYRERGFTTCPTCGEVHEPRECEECGGRGHGPFGATIQDGEDLHREQEDCPKCNGRGSIIDHADGEELACDECVTWDAPAPAPAVLDRADVATRLAVLFKNALYGGPCSCEAIQARRDAFEQAAVFLGVEREFRALLTGDATREVRP